MPTFYKEKYSFKCLLKFVWYWEGMTYFVPLNKKKISKKCHISTIEFRMCVIFNSIAIFMHVSIPLPVVFKVGVLNTVGESWSHT